MDYENYELIEDMRSELFRFWDRADEWPSDTADYVFLGRAQTCIGKALFPSIWTGLEMKDQSWPFLVLSDDHKEPYDVYDYNIGWGRDYIDLILETHRPDLLTRDPLSFEAIDTASRLYAVHEQARRESYAMRLAAVRAKLKQSLIDGVLTGFAQHLNGGTEFEAIDKLQWTGLKAKTWLMFCHNGNLPLSPYTYRRRIALEDLPSFVFIGRKSFTEFLSNIAPPIIGQQSNHSEPPSRAYPLDKIVEWLQSVYAPSQPLQPPITKVVEAAKQQFPGISREAVREAVGLGLPTSWTNKRGPRRPRNNSAA